MLRAYIDLWSCINAYTTACGGDSSSNNTSDKRMEAVVEINRIVNYIEDLHEYLGKIQVIATVLPPIQSLLEWSKNEEPDGDYLLQLQEEVNTTCQTLLTMLQKMKQDAAQKDNQTSNCS